jgi:hypothetical protein
MRNRQLQVLNAALTILFTALVGMISILPAKAQNPELQQRVADLKESMAKNKQATAQYTWTETVTISLKGEQKKQEHFQVRIGPDGKPQKTSLDPPAEAAAPKGGRMKQHVVEKKKEEYKDYADQMKALAQQYIPPDKDKLQQAYQQGNIMMGPAAGAPNQIQLVIKNYVKPNDSMTLLFDKAEKQLLSLKVASYMDDAKDAMNLTVQFDRLPDGTNHASNTVIDGVSKQLNIAMQNSNYQHL